MEEKTGKKWYWRVIDFINPLRDPSLTVAAVLTFIEEAGTHDPWYSIIIIALVNWLAVRGVVWLIVNFAFASTFLGRRLWWTIIHPRLAWRILDAVGHEEIVIGGGLSDGVIIQDGNAIVSPALSASGIHIIGELPAGTAVPMLGMPNGQMTPDLSGFAGSGLFPGMAGNGYNNYNNNYISPQNTGGIAQGFPQRPSEEEERVRQQLAAYARLLDDWIEHAEEKWRTVSDSQLGWKPLRGRWGSWDDIFQDVYAAKTSDPMAQAAQTSGEATTRRFDVSKDKGTAASAVACFMRDMLTLRSGLDLIQQPGDRISNTSPQQAAQQFTQGFGGRNSGPLRKSASNGHTRGNTLIRQPAQIFVDADTDK